MEKRRTMKKLNYGQAYRWGTEQLREADIAEAELNARLLLEFVCGTDRNTLLVHGERELTVIEDENYVNLISERKKHIPLQYLTGVQEFMGLEFYVNQNEKDEQAAEADNAVKETDRKQFEMIVSNPPYIRRDVIDTLMPEVREYEPILALDGKEDGLYFYREILKQAGTYLARGGELFFEIGHDQGQAVKELMETSGFREVEVIQDYAGLDRVVCGTWW